jgi:hypothetical protein
MRPRRLLVVPVLALAGCGGSSTVPPDKVEGAIRSLGYDVRFRDVEQPPQIKVFAGRLRDPRTGASIDFSVVVGEGFDGPDDEPIVPGAGASSSTGCAKAGVTTSAGGNGRDKAERDRMDRMSWALEDAIFALAPEAYCEG